MQVPTPVSWVIQGKQFAGELWGNDGAMPVIALHGWLDNCHSFRPLAPLLDAVQLLAVDMAGHGHTGPRSPDASYHIWDDVREILMIADDMGWQKFSLLGHSRGAIIAALIAAVAPERVERLVLIEGLLPQTMRPEDMPAQLSRFVHRYLGSNGIQKGYRNLEEMIALRRRGALALGEASARIIVERNSKQRDGFYYWTTDFRLRLPSPVMLTDDEAEAVVRALTCPALLVLASDGMGKQQDIQQKIASLNQRVHCITVPGNHHAHMEEAVGEVAAQINRFLRNVGL